MLSQTAFAVALSQGSSAQSSRHNTDKIDETLGDTIGQAGRLSMSTSQETIWEQFTELVGRISSELALAEPGKDTGLMPINCLLLQLQDLVTSSVASAEIKEAAACARKWVDHFIENGFQCSEEEIGRAHV